VVLYDAYVPGLLGEPKRLDEEQLRNRTPELHARLKHLYWMCGQALELANHDLLEKAMRWLGFIQGSLWCLGIRSIEDMKKDNMPKDEEFNGKRV
jgi:hypothetical protein